MSMLFSFFPKENFYIRRRRLRIFLQPYFVPNKAPQATEIQTKHRQKYDISDKEN